MSKIPPPGLPNEYSASSPEKPKISGLALASLLLGIASYPLICVYGIGVLAGIGAVILGIIARAAIHKNPHLHGGKNGANIGIASGVVMLFLFFAILQPGLRQAREAAKRVYCLSNLRGLGMASFMYQGSNNGFFPAPAVTPPAYNDWIYWQPRRNPDEGKLVAYQGGHFDPKSYICPTDPLGRRAGAYPYSYSANVNVFIIETAPSPAIPTKPLRYMSIHSPATTIMLVEEGTAITSVWIPQFWTPNGTTNILSLRHDKSKTPAAFTDGHSELLMRTDAMTPHDYDPLAP